MIRFKKMSWLGVGVVALLGSLTGSAHAASPARADEAAIRAQTTSWGKAYNGGDPKGVAALYAEDALLLAPGASGVTGRAAILEFFTRDIAGSKAAGAVFVLHSKTDVGVSGNMGWESGTYE
ncbi:MAG: SgcJ/EcaC family oxidoreductase, partial [Thermoanaerobaculia bacterium]|nr:SgcJ/EcaC family oxidoreductase [Thermoanaerobaculia bacterium]